MGAGSSFADRGRKDERRKGYTSGMTIRKPARKRKTPVHGPAIAEPLPPGEFWHQMMVLFRSIPEEERARMPRDAARNFDHYLDGTARQD